MLYFITGNQHKFSEIHSILDGQVEQLNIDLPEIQDFDAHNIIRAKLQEAFKHHSGQFIVEDTSLYLEGLNGLPGPLIKWFMQQLGRQGMSDLANRLNNQKAVAKTLIGYAQSPDQIHFFEGSISGIIVAPRGNSQFGWDPIFQPDGHTQTFAEMGHEMKSSLSMRKIATQKLKSHLTNSSQPTPLP